jgi:peroxiredoxin
MVLEVEMAKRSGSRKFILCLFAFLLLAAPLRAQFSANELSPPPEMIGKVAPRWNLKVWLNTAAPVETSQFRGKVVLLRFFNDNPMGAAAVRELSRSYQAQGLATVGIYAPSPTPTSVDPEMVKDLALALGFTFPIGVDSGWQAVTRYWMTQADVEALAATFLIDRNGLVRYVQPDGRYEKNSKDRAARKQFENLEKMLKALLDEPPPEDVSTPPDPPAAEPPTNPAG